MVKVHKSQSISLLKMNNWNWIYIFVHIKRIKTETHIRKNIRASTANCSDIRIDMYIAFGKYSLIYTTEYCDIIQSKLWYKVEFVISRNWDFIVNWHPKKNIIIILMHAPTMFQKAGHCDQNISVNYCTIIAKQFIIIYYYFLFQRPCFRMLQLSVHLNWIYIIWHPN